MPDLTLILGIVAVAAAVAGFFIFARKQAADKPAAPAPAAQPEPAGPSKAEVALQVALRQAIDKLHASVPAEAAKPAPAPIPAVPTASVPVTAPTWQEPPAPWPIDARALSAEQVAALSPDAAGRANMWQQAFMSAAITGNGANPVPVALLIYRAGFTPSDQLSAPLSPVWKQIFAAYGVPEPAVKAPVTAAEWTGDFDPASVWQKPGDLGYMTREEMYAGRAPWLYKRDQQRQAAGQ